MKKWYRLEFSRPVIDYLRNLMDNKNTALAFNNLDAAFRGRYIGLCGELVFRGWAWQNQHGCRHLTDATTIDKYDFRMYGENIDVKTASVTIAAQLEEPAYVLETQFNKLARPDCQVSMLVFCKYFFPDHSCMVVGWISKAEFLAKAVFVPAGNERWYRTSSTAQWEVPLSELHPMDELFSTIKPVTKEPAHA